MDSVDFVTQVAEALTGNRSEVEFEEDSIGVIITIRTFGGVGNIIGRNGSTLHAIGVVAKALGYNGKHRVKILIDECEEKA